MQLINNLSQQPTLGDYLKQKKKDNSWVYGEGFIKGKADEKLTASDLRKGKGGYQEFTYLNNSNCVDAKNFTEAGIGKISIMRGKYYQWGRTQKLFEPPLLLIKKGIDRKTIPTYLSDEPLSYRARIFGVHAPISDKDELVAINKYIKDNIEIIRFYIISTSAEILIGRATAIFTEDIMNIPFVTDTKTPLLSEADQIVLQDTLTYHLNVFEESIFRNAVEAEIYKFTSVFCKCLNSVYETQGRFFQLFKILDAGEYYVVHFEYTAIETAPTTEITSNLEDYISSVIQISNKASTFAKVHRILKIYGRDKLIIIKPKQFRYWLPSIALRDADETFNDYIKSNYPNA